MMRGFMWRGWMRCRSIALRAKGWLAFGRHVGVFGDFKLGNPANIRLGRGCAINEGVFILGHNHVEIGDGVVLSAGAMLIDAGLGAASFAPGGVRAYSERKGIWVGEEAWIGAGAIVLPGVTIGKRAIVGAGSVVTRDVSAHTIVVGNPARAIGRTDE